jgi:hypothetical protein
MTTPQPPSAFVGWHQPRGGAWRAACEGATHGEALDRLLVLDLPSGSMIVLEVGRHPDQTSSTRRSAPRGQRQCTEQQRELFS